MEFRIPAGRVKDMANQEFGLVTVVRLAGVRVGGRGLYWWCRCRCGVEKPILRNNLARTHSCGCETATKIREAKSRQAEPTRQARQRGEICRRCSRPRVSGTTMCAVCNTVNSARISQRQKANRTAGLCTCGNIPTPGARRCTRCNERERRLGSTRKDQGVCSKCGVAVLRPGEAKCDGCRSKVVERRRKLTVEVISAYGGRCQECGIDDIRFLTIDHTNDDGAAHRKVVPSQRFYAWLKRNGFPEGFTCLCYNHNIGKRRIIEEVDQAPNPFRKSLAKLKREVLGHYGGVCQCCGVDDVRYLTIDHVDLSGNQHRRELGIKSGHAFYRWLRKSGYPGGYATVCFNCNCGKARCGGVCPHRADVATSDIGMDKR